MSAGDRRAGAVRTRPRVLGGLAAGIVVAAVAWLFLVRAAIAFGQAARHDGDAAQWLLTVVAALGAALCLLLALLLAIRLRAALAPQAPYQGSHRR